MVSSPFLLSFESTPGFLKRTPAIDGGANLISMLRAVLLLLVIISLTRPVSPASRKPFPEGSSKETAIEMSGSEDASRGHGLSLIHISEPTRPY